MDISRPPSHFLQPPLLSRLRSVLPSSSGAFTQHRHCTIIIGVPNSASLSVSSPDDTSDDTAGQLVHAGTSLSQSPIEDIPPPPATGFTIGGPFTQIATPSASCCAVIDELFTHGNASLTAHPRLNGRSLRIYPRTYTEERCEASEP